MARSTLGFPVASAPAPAQLTPEPVAQEALSPAPAAAGIAPIDVSAGDLPAAPKTIDDQLLGGPN